MIGTMSCGLALGLGALGVWNQANEIGFSWWTALGTEWQEVPKWVELGFVISLAFVTPTLMLYSPSLWRKWAMWMGMMILYVVWIPVLALAAWRMGMMAPLVAGLWSGLCAMIFASRHELPCDVLMEQNEVRGGRA